jgi:hypothetical protein
MAFYTLLTNIGKAKLANATALGTTVQLTHIAVGDGNGAAITPVDTATVLTHEVWRASLNSIAVDPANTNWIVAEGYIPSTSGGFTVREVGLFDIDGDLIAIGSYPDTYKPTLASGSAKDLYIKVIIEVTNSSTVTLKIDPAVVLSTRSYVDSKVVEHEAKADPHSQYLTIDKIHAAPFESTLGGTDEWAIWDSFTGLLRKISVTGFISYLASIFVQPSQLFGIKNLLINANGLINQRGYVSGTATTVANQYTLDRWRVVVSGQNLTFSTVDGVTTFTAPAGGVEQVIENLNVIGGSHTITIGGTATATVSQSTDNVTYTVVTQSNGVYTITGGNYIKINFASGTFSLPQFERGSIATPFENRPYGLELSLCHRYYQKFGTDTSALVITGLYSNGASSTLSFPISLPVPMRVIPTVSSLNSVSTNVTSISVVPISNRSLDIRPVASALGFVSLSYTSPSSYITASAEL